MAVIIGSARRDENGKGRGGQPGDQDEIEVSTQDWYVTSKGWNIIRAKDARTREKIAYAMQRACDNSNIGYDKNDRYTAYNWCKKHNNYDPGAITEPVEVDCSALIRLCCAYAGIYVSDFYTGNEMSVLNATGKFITITNPAITNSSDYLMRGDILVTRVVGHTAVVLSNGSLAPEIIGVAHSKDNMNIRDKNSTIGKVIDTIKLNSWVNVVEICDNGWYKVKIGDKYGYTSNVRNKYYEFYSTTQSKKYTASGNVYIRKGPGITYRSTGVIKKGESVEVDLIVDKWGHLSDGRGFSSLKYLN